MEWAERAERAEVGGASGVGGRVSGISGVSVMSGVRASEGEWLHERTRSGPSAGGKPWTQHFGRMWKPRVDPRAFRRACRASHCVMTKYIVYRVGRITMQQGLEVRAG